MKHKKSLEILSVITAITCASSLMGCAATSQDEMVNMLNNGDQIEIEVATPDFEEQGTESTLTWVELGSLDTYPDMRTAIDGIFGNTATADGKTGAFYTDAEGNTVNNNTLKVVLTTAELDIEKASDTLADAAASNYADIEADDTATAINAAFNGYFNILQDNEPNYANMDESLTRAEFMSAVFRADTPVQDLEADKDFETAVGSSDFNIYAQGVESNSYLSTDNKSLDKTTYNGTITKAEAIYTLVSRYYADELKSVDLSTTDVTFKDAKENSTIAKDNNIDTKADYAESYILNAAIQNADKGLPTDLYKALVVAAQHGIIESDSETEWDTALTKDNYLTLLMNCYSNESSSSSSSSTELTQEEIDNLQLDGDAGVVDVDGIGVSNDEVCDYLDNRPQSEIDKDGEDGYIGVSVQTGEDGTSYGVSVVDGKTVYHIGDMMPTGERFTGYPESNVKDYIAKYRATYPDDTTTDAELQEMWDIAFN